MTLISLLKLLFALTISTSVYALPLYTCGDGILEVG